MKIKVILPLIALLVCSCKGENLKKEIDIIPKPVEITLKDGTYVLSDRVVIGYPENNEELKKAAEMISEILSKALSLPVSVSLSDGKENIRIDEMSGEHKSEAYRLDISSDGVQIGANSYPAAIFAMQSIMQMLPPKVYSPNGAKIGVYHLPAVSIYDYPRFDWRGIHLDVSRHFFPIEFIYKYIDMLSVHKFNKFHWHLTDDPGWRIEIKKYPKLTEVAAWRATRSEQDSTWNKDEAPKDDEPNTYGGFYTQQQIRDVVKYASDRGVTIVPEIEMPGHSAEIFAAYPELSCLEKKQNMITGAVYPEGYSATLCAGNDHVFEFMEDVLDEVIELFPSEYIHIGGDEADKRHWKDCPKCKERMRKEKLKTVEELQSYFVKRIEKYISSKGRKLIGWDEILEGGLAPDATVMSWRGMSGGVEAANADHYVVMTPASHLYFDYYQNTPEVEPAAIGGFNTIKKVYGFEPIPEQLDPSKHKYILGAQANLWTEYITTTDQVEYMTVPRMTALSEVVWSPKDSRNWTDFQRRLYTAQLPRFDAMKINYHKGADYVIFTADYDKETNLFTVGMESEMYGVQIYYTIDGSEPTVSSLLYDNSPVKIDKSAVIKAVVAKDGVVVSKKPSERMVGYHKGIGKDVKYNSPLSDSYRASGVTTLCDGFTGSNDINDGFNQGIANQDMDIVFDMGESASFSSVKGSFLQSIGAWIYFPEELIIYTSEDGKKFEKVASQKCEFDGDFQMGHKIIEINGDFKGRYIKVVAVCLVTPEGFPGAGSKNWIFSDEIFID